MVSSRWEFILLPLGVFDFVFSTYSTLPLGPFYYKVSQVPNWSLDPTDLLHDLFLDQISFVISSL